MAKEEDKYIAKVNGLERHASWLSEYYLNKARRELRQPTPNVQQL